MLLPASPLPRSSRSWSLTAHAPTRIQFVKLGGAWRGSLVSPARKLLKLSFAGSSFIPYGNPPAVSASISGHLLYASSRLGQAFSSVPLPDFWLVSRLSPELSHALFPLIVILFRVANEGRCRDDFDDEIVQQCHRPGQGAQHIHEKHHANGIGVIPNFMGKSVVEKEAFPSSQWAMVSPTRIRQASFSFGTISPR